MPTNRKVVFANEEIYHVFNRGVEKRPVFTSKREYTRAIETMRFYHYKDSPKKLSEYLLLSFEEKLKFLNEIQPKLSRKVEIIAYCFMPNHFHFLLKQKDDDGISRFLADFTNSYTKYFNAKHERIGPLFQGLFKAVHVDSEEQLVHLSRYIHLNPVSSFIIEPEELEEYPWSSYPEYLSNTNQTFVKKDIVLNFFQTKSLYRTFVIDQISLAQELDKIKHLTLD